MDLGQEIVEALREKVEERRCKEEDAHTELKIATARALQARECLWAVEKVLNAQKTAEDQAKLRKAAKL